MKTYRSFALVVAVAALALPPALHAWGQNGHRIVGEVGERHLTDQARQAIAEIAPGEGLAEASTWPDDIRSDSNWNEARPWHFISIDDDETLANTSRSADGDVLEAIRRFEKILRDPQTAKEEKLQALRFYVHFVGDIHQPLHVGRRADRGGNRVRVEWFREPRNLHSVWDSGLIDSESLSFSEFADFIDDASAGQIADWQADPYEEWVRESYCLRSAVYDFGMESPGEGEDEPRLGYVYAYTKGPIIDEQLLKGGIRLAGRLNDIFAGKPSPASPESIPPDPGAWCAK